ncbi:M16 family metallopeptidase [Streptomyces panaciradicis]|uniref:M16 family metallopeptidase n=1 Tax=Streptomyces panaciradicis TaxID=1470261 RepID=UPI00201D02A2|nr:insulinase family protein [Streptomyces panaciradicis]MCL6667617.1 insulinase family protein [Streptomyces panaciradicis]
MTTQDMTAQDTSAPDVPHAPDATAQPDLAALDGLVGHTTVDGIPALFAPRPGPLTAGLLFRVGRADETLPTTGVTHLVEHLALHRLGLSDLHYNGATADAYTLFHVTGDEDEVVTYLNGVRAALRDLPLERLETEKEILRTEAGSRGNGPLSQMPLWRYGAQGYGLASYDELGTRSLTADQVRHWAETRFTRDNAVLWLTGDRLPEGLDLTLPAGRRFPAPAATDALPVTPAYIRGDDGHVVFTSVVRRSTAAAVFAEVLGRALFKDLRQQGGYSYSAEADYTPRDADFATLTAYADALPQKQDAALGGFVDVFARLRAGRVEQAELDSARGKLRRRYEVPDLGAALLPSYAHSLLLGHRLLTPERHRAELEAVTVEDLCEVARAAWDGGLLQVPTRGAEWAGPTPAPQYSETGVSGTLHPSLDDDDVTLVIGDTGVTLSLPAGLVTVRYDACAAMTTRPDGARYLTGLDGFRVAVEPTLYGDVTPERIAVLDAAVPDEAVVPLPARREEEIPRPRERRATAPAAGTETPAAKEKRAWKWSLGLLLILGVDALFGAGVLLTAVQLAESAAPRWSRLLPAVVPGILLLRITYRTYLSAQGAAERRT